MTINSSSIPALRVARSVKRRKRAEGGGIFDWSNVGSGNPDTTNSKTLPDPFLAVGKRMLWDLPKEAVENARANPLPGLRREDYTDVPADTSPDPQSPLGGVGIKAPRVGWQPVDQMVGSSLEAGANVMGGTALGAPARATGEFVAGAGPVRRNPSPRAIDAAIGQSEHKSLRGLVDDEGAFVWDAGDKTHHDQAAALGLNYDINNRFHVTPAGDGYYQLDIGPEWAHAPDKILSNPHLVRLLSNEKMLIDSGGGRGPIPGPEFLRDLKGATHEPAVAPEAAPIAGGPAAEAAGDVAGGLGGSTGRGAGLEEAPRTAERWAGQRAPVEGLPVKPQYIEGHGYLQPGPIGRIHDVAEGYMRTHRPEVPYSPPREYRQVDPEHSKAIAQAYEDMQHAPNDPAVKNAYEAMINETKAQYDAIKATGLKIEPIPTGMPDPYAANPRLAAHDVAENNHLWFFPTEGGFGTVNKITDNPLLRKMGEKIGDHEMTANDMFRVVHDYFGHLKEGHGFRAAGEDNAWRSHSAMYSDLARPAMTSETRGQNSWVNYGPHGEKNRTASGADTTYADQKVGLMPDWTMYDAGQMPMVGYQGSPHSHGKYDSAWFGKGEGNAVFGEGHYFGSVEPTGQWYRNQLAARRDPILRKHRLTDYDGAILGNDLANTGGKVEPIISDLKDYVQSLKTRQADGDTTLATKNMINRSQRMIRYLGDPERSKGHLYKVAIETPPERLLDWDATLRNQPAYIQERVTKEVMEGVERQKQAIEVRLNQLHGKDPVYAGGANYANSSAGRQRRERDIINLEQKLKTLDAQDFSGQEIYKRMGLPASGPIEAASKATRALRSLEIPGLKYLDQVSRTGGKGTHNYVIFNDDILKILRKYGIAGVPAAGVAAGAAGGEERAAGGRVHRAEGGMLGSMLGSLDGPFDQQILEPGSVPAGVGRGAIQLGAIAPVADPVMKTARQAKTYAKPEYAPSGALIINKGVDNPPDLKVQTVADPHRMMYPGIYRNPRIIAQEAAARVGEEDPAMKRLFGVTRGDLREMAQGRVGNEDPRLSLAKNPSGSLAAQNIQTPRNTQRLIDILGEAGKHEGLRTADAWYIMDPVFRRMVELHGPAAAERYRKFNTMTGMASPGSDVLTEIQRGTAAHWLQNKGRFDDFMKYAGIPEELRGRIPFPTDMRTLPGHVYHRTSQGEPMQKFLNTGMIQSEKPKVPLYVHASGVPETGFQTTGPVGDAHFSRGVGLADTRGKSRDVGSSFSRAEYQTLQPWWQQDVAGKAKLESVPAQARLWTALGPQTGVESALGAPKLELLAKQIMEAAQRRRISPERARDMVLSGEAGAFETGGAVNSAMDVARSIRRAKGGAVHIGPIVGSTDGRADKVAMEVPDGSYVLTADHCSAMGEGNTLAGFEKLKKMFPKSVAAYKAAKARGPVKRASGGRVPIMAADGEFVICPEDITERWGDLDTGHRVLDHWQTSERKNHIKTLAKLAPPAQD